MDVINAKKVLSGYQSGQPFLEDSQLTDAMKLMETNSELAAWFEDMLSFDKQIKGALDSLPEPTLQKQRLLNEVAKISGKSRWKTAVKYVGLLAALLMVSAVGFFGYAKHYNNQIHEYATLREGMSHYIAGSYFLLDYMDGDLGRISNWLDSEDLPNFENLPPALLAKDPIGCKRLNWQGNDVTLVCFHREDGKIIHLFIAEEGDLSPTAIANIKSIYLSHGLETGGWMSDGKVYLLTGSEPGVTVSEYLG